MIIKLIIFKKLKQLKCQQYLNKRNDKNKYKMIIYIIPVINNSASNIPITTILLISVICITCIINTQLVTLSYVPHT